MAKSAFHTNLPNVKPIEYLDQLPYSPYKCPCCGYLTLSTRSENERCGVCAWVDTQDGECTTKANAGTTLDLARKNFRKFGACSKEYLNKTRAARFKEMPKENEIPSTPQRTEQADSDKLEELENYRRNNVILKDNIPEAFYDLIPLVQKWGIGDDAIRGYATDTITPNGKREIQTALRGKLESINAWINTISEGEMSSSAAAFMYFLEAIEEMELILS